ncbi:MAG TPA: hypothetical protein HA263_07880 [Methanoregulaceae archaeon]|nr:hypothetical protein [Methanoregulaceae archaeon]
MSTSEEAPRPVLQRICVSCGRTYYPADDAPMCRPCTLANRASHVPLPQQTLGGRQ